MFCSSVHAHVGTHTYTAEAALSSSVVRDERFSCVHCRGETPPFFFVAGDGTVSVHTWRAAKSLLFAPHAAGIHATRVCDECKPTSVCVPALSASPPRPSRGKQVHGHVHQSTRHSGKCARIDWPTLALMIMALRHVRMWGDN